VHRFLRDAAAGSNSSIRIIKAEAETPGLEGAEKVLAVRENITGAGMVEVDVMADEFSVKIWEVVDAVDAEMEEAREW